MMSYSAIRQPLQKVKPQRALWVTPMKCEYIAAEIRNNTVESMQEGDIADVGYRYLQTRRGEANCIKEAMVWSMTAALIFTSLQIFENESDASKALLYLAILLCLFHVAPSLGNAARYNETKSACDTWLQARLSPDKVKKIQALQFNQAGMRALNQFFKTEAIDVSSIAHRENKKDAPCSCWDMSR